MGVDFLDIIYRLEKELGVRFVREDFLGFIRAILKINGRKNQRVIIGVLFDIGFAVLPVSYEIGH